MVYVNETRYEGGAQIRLAREADAGVSNIVVDLRAFTDGTRVRVLDDTLPYGFAVMSEWRDTRPADAVVNAIMDVLKPVVDDDFTEPEDWLNPIAQSLSLAIPGKPPVVRHIPSARAPADGMDMAVMDLIAAAGAQT